MNANPLKTLARLARFERATAWFVAKNFRKGKQSPSPRNYGAKGRFLAALSMICAALWGSPAGATIVIGDSISACQTCWMGQLQREGGWYKNLAQSMRFAVQYEIPADLAPRDGHEDAVYWLGTNDALLEREYPGEVFPLWKEQFHKHISTLLDRGYRVLIVLVPSVPDGWTDQFRAHQQLYCGVMVHHFKREGLACFDPDSIGFGANTTDGVHPTEDFSRHMGQVIERELEALK